MAKSNSLSLINAALLPEFVEQLPLIDWTEYAKNFPKISFTSDSFRSKQEFIINSQEQIEYVAADAGIVALEMEKFFKDLKVLVKTKLSFAETLYYAAMLYLALLKIHPFEDGNGRMARLLEKWFLASQLGPEAWNIPSEQFYYQNLSAYYRNVHLGFDYETVDYQRSLPFLLMLPQAIQHQS